MYVCVLFKTNLHFHPQEILRKQCVRDVAPQKDKLCRRKLRERDVLYLVRTIYALQTQQGDSAMQSVLKVRLLKERSDSERSFCTIQCIGGGRNMDPQRESL